MAPPLLRTKLFIPPTRPRLVPRPRLIERLDAGLQGKLTLVSAPAGFGKTTVLSEWIASSEVPAAWVTLDEGDNVLSTFLEYLVGALQTLPQCQAEGGLGAGLLVELRSPQPPRAESLLITLINQITDLSEQVVLVLDDYHLIEAQEVHDAVAFLLDHLPPQMHLVIATRSDPVFPRSRLRARGHLAELRAADLRFSNSEAAAFLRQGMGLDLSAEDIDALERRTEGWIAGLQLAALALQARPTADGSEDAGHLIESFGGTHRLVLDYLIEEVLERQAESVQEFLLRTSVLDRLTGSLCDEVRASAAMSQIAVDAPAADDSQAMLEMLEDANLFIVPLDAEQRWFRYHRLFSDLLRQRLHRTHPGLVPTLQVRASLWYERSGYLDEAIEYARRANAFARAACLIDGEADAVWVLGEHSKLRRWLAWLPDEVLATSPNLSVFRAWYLFTSGKRGDAERALEAVEHEFVEAGQLNGVARARLQGRIAVTRCMMATYQADVPRIVEHARLALQHLPEQDHPNRAIAAMALGDVYGFSGDMPAAYKARLAAFEESRSRGSSNFSVLAATKVAITLREQGRLRAAIEMCQQQVEAAGRAGLPRGAAVGSLLAVEGEAWAEMCDLETAVLRARQGEEMAARSADLATVGWIYLCLVRVLFSRGDMTGAEAVIGEVEATAREANVPSWITRQMGAWKARLQLAQGNLQAASLWARVRGLTAAGDAPAEQAFGFFALNDHVVLARVLIAQGRLDDAIRLLRRLVVAAEAGGRISTSIEVLGLQALAHQARAEADLASCSLERALALAAPRGFVQTFVDDGPPMASLLHEALRRGIMPDYAGRVLTSFPVGGPQQADPAESGTNQSGLVEALSGRELEVLQLVSAGLTNREIGSRLFLSPNTIKAHTRSIYGKLEVHSRTQAIAKGRAYGLLTDD